MRASTTSITPQNLNSRLKNSKSLSELRKHANEHFSIMDAIHDSVICVWCGRFGSSSDVRMRVECRDFSILLPICCSRDLKSRLGEELERLQISYMLEVNKVDSHHDVMRRLL